MSFVHIFLIYASSPLSSSSLTKLWTARRCPLSAPRQLSFKETGRIGRSRLDALHHLMYSSLLPLLSDTSFFSTNIGGRGHSITDTSLPFHSHISVAVWACVAAERSDFPEIDLLTETSHHSSCWGLHRKRSSVKVQWSCHFYLR